MAKLFFLVLQLAGLYIGLKVALWVGQAIWDFIDFII